MRRGGTSAPDPMPSRPDTALWASAYEGKVFSTPVLNAGETFANFLVWGQSLAGASSQGLYTPVNHTKVDNIDKNTGGVYKAADPLLGCGLATDPSNRASPWTRIADSLITAGWRQRIMLAPCALGGTSIAEWESAYLNWITGTYRRCVHAGLPVTAVTVQIGETDTGLGTSQAAYKASMLSVRAKVIAAGCTAPWLIAKSTTYIPGPVSDGIRAAIDDIVATVPGCYAGPDCDALGASYRYDGQHWNAAGNAAAAALWVSSIQAALL